MWEKRQRTASRLWNSRADASNHRSFRIDEKCPDKRASWPMLSPHTKAGALPFSRSLREILSCQSSGIFCGEMQERAKGEVFFLRGKKYFYIFLCDVYEK